MMASPDVERLESNPPGGLILRSRGAPMTLERNVFCAILTAGLTVTALAWTPEPSPVPTSWELSLKPAMPERISVDTGGGPVTYWYMIYTVVNNTGQDIDFHPEIARVSESEAELSAEQARSAGDRAPTILTEPAILGLHARVYGAIRDRHSKTYPFLVPPVDAMTRLRQGNDNALASVAVFHDLPAGISKFTIYVTGLSGERVSRPNPAYRSSPEADRKGQDEAGQPRFFVLRKTLAMPFTLPGDSTSRRIGQAALGRMTWVMR
jgi:hypothetical protein